MKKAVFAILVALVVLTLTATVVVMAHEENSSVRSSYSCSLCGGTTVDEFCSDIYGNDAIHYQCSAHNHCTKYEYYNTRVVACHDCGQPYSTTMHLHAIYHSNGVVEDVCAYND
nr:hypothetical protein [Clostridia bacterium]